MDLSLLKLPDSWKSYLLLLVLILSIGGLGYWAEQTAFNKIALCFSLAFVAYFIILSDKKLLQNWRFWLVVGLLLRMILLFGMPTLSDDIYRFIWDGRLWLVGEHPFAELPVAIMERPEQPPGINNELFQLLNSPAYYTVYPPFAQATFVLACSLFFKQILGATIILKLILWACELGTLLLMPVLLKRINLPQHNVLIYALNPLIIVELVGNLHYEAAMVFFLLLAMYALLSQKKWISALFFTGSILAKLLTLLFLPFIWTRLGWRKSIPYYILVIGLTLFCFLPLYNETFIRGFGSSIDLYFRKFEFNASLFYLMRWVAYPFTGYNIIQLVGPKLGFLAVATIGLWGLLDRKTDWASFFQRALFSICLYLFLSTTVHPWYTVLPIACCVFTNYRFPIIWSALIWLTYLNYSYPVYSENLWIVALEYTIVFSWLLKEWLQQKKYPDQVWLFGKNRSAYQQYLKMSNP
jgi:hypothetical protein